MNDSFPVELPLTRKMTLVERYQQEKNPQCCTRVCGTSCWEARSLDDRKDFEPCEYCNLLEVMRRLEHTKKDEERLQRQQQRMIQKQRPTTASSHNNGYFPDHREYMSTSPVSMAHSFSPVSQRSTSPSHLPKLKPSTVRAGWLAGHGPLADATLLAKMKWVAEMKKSSPELTKIMLENMNVPMSLPDSQITTPTASPAPYSGHGSKILSPSASTVNLFPVIPQVMTGISPSPHNINNSLTSSSSDSRQRKSNTKPFKTTIPSNTTHTPSIAPSNLVATYYAQAFSPITIPTTNSYTLPPDYLDTNLMDNSFNSTDESMESLYQMSDLSNAPPSPSMNMFIQRPIPNIQSMNMMMVQKPISKRPQTALISNAPLLPRRPKTASPTRSHQRPSSPLALRLFEKSRTESPLYWGSMCDASMKRYHEGSSQHYSLRRNP